MHGGGIGRQANRNPVEQEGRPEDGNEIARNLFGGSTVLIEKQVNRHPGRCDQHCHRNKTGDQHTVYPEAHELLDALGIAGTKTMTQQGLQ